MNENVKEPFQTVLENWLACQGIPCTCGLSYFDAPKEHWLRHCDRGLAYMHLAGRPPRPQCDRCSRHDAGPDPVPIVFACLYKCVCESCARVLSEIQDNKIPPKEHPDA